MEHLPPVRFALLVDYVADFNHRLTGKDIYDFYIVLFLILQLIFMGFDSFYNQLTVFFIIKEGRTLNQRLAAQMVDLKPLAGGVDIPFRYAGQLY